MRTTRIDTPLTDDELDELDEVLASLPEEREPLDVAMLDGFLTGMLLSPGTILPSRWLPIVFDARDGQDLIPGDEARVQRVLELVMRHYNMLAAHVAAREAFMPIVVEIERLDGRKPTRKQRFAGLWPWAAGFARAVAEFPLVDEDSDAVYDIEWPLMQIVRHLPFDPEDKSEAARSMAWDARRFDREFPLVDVDQAVNEMVSAVMAIADITRPRVPVEREGPKVGRNDPCPCGSGKKYKQCHGRDAS